MEQVEDPTNKSRRQTHNRGNLQNFTELDTTVVILTTSDRRALHKANRLRALSPRSTSRQPSTPDTTSSAMNPSELPIHQPQHRRPANDEMIPSYLDARPGALGVTITNVAAAVKQAYDSGGRVLKLRAGDRAILEREFPGLGGCSRYAYDSILSPLLNVLDTLKGIDGAMENWAFRVKRMNLQRAALGMFHFL